jgi:thymidylate synthase ThyX
MAIAGKPEPEPASSAEVYAIYGVEPEIQAYAMAKYSRSALSLKESLREISGQRAEKFLQTFYFQYGHRSIADLAHLAFALERLSLLAAIAVVDEQRWDGQERSTRYQDFSHPDYYLPPLAGDRGLQRLYRETIEFLFSEYRDLSAAMFERLSARTPRPPEMKPEAYERTLRARAFDIARYLLPLATNTSLGQIVSARTLESQISRLLSSRFSELRDLGEKLKAAAKNAAYIPDGGTKEVRPAPTLMKYAEPSAYQRESRQELENAARQVMGEVPIAEAPAVDLLDDDPVEIELAATLLYEHCSCPYRQIRERVLALDARERQGLVELGIKHRGKHDELLRAYYSGGKFRFDILMDIGGFRDMHRHRRCIQIGQEFVLAHGFATPPDVAGSPFAGRYAAAMQRAAEAARQLAAGLSQPGAEPREAQYLLPLAYRKRTLFKMDFAEAVYITELRTAPAGHFSYRQIAWQMYQEVARRHPALAGCFRVHDPKEPWDLLQR